MASSQQSAPCTEMPHPGEAQPRFLKQTNLSALFDALANRGFQVIGPVARDGAIVLEPIKSIEDLPLGMIEELKPGEYRLKHGTGPTLLGHTPGLQSWKKYLFPAEVKLWSAERQNGAFRILNNETRPDRPFAFFGVRPCDLSAIAVQDRVLTGDKYRDPIYAACRDGTFIVTVQCTRAAETCFCASMGTGPRAQPGFDLALTELTNESDEHGFLLEAGSQRGLELLADLETSPATERDVASAHSAIDEAARQQVRSIDVEGLRDLLVRNFDSPRWLHVSQRCLSCGNCTMVCPTCFCTSVEDHSNIAADRAERWRRWDSCFSINHSYIHGGAIRSSAKARYRQWLMHKLAWWIDQFGATGCVGCGRCITWCPVGIDITEEARALRGGETHGKS